MPELVVETPEGVALRFEIAGAGTGATAALIDVLVLGGTLFLAALLLFTLGLGMSVVLIGSGIVVAIVAYFFLFSVFWGGRTPGKFLLGVRVVDEGGLPARPAQHLLRSLFFPLEALVLAAPLPLALMLVAATPRRQRFGDLVAGTLVLREPEREAPREPFARERWSALEHRSLGLVPAHASRFGPEDLSYLRELLARTGLDPRARSKLLRSSARHYAERLERAELEFDSARAYAFLRELFLFLRETRTRSETAPLAWVTRSAGGAGARGSARASGSRPR